MRKYYTNKCFHRMSSRLIVNASQVVFATNEPEVKHSEALNKT